jgi:hypothetical protein
MHTLFFCSYAEADRGNGAMDESLKGFAQRGQQNGGIFKEGIRIGGMDFTVNEKAIMTPAVSRIQPPSLTR